MSSSQLSTTEVLSGSLLYLLLAADSYPLPFDCQWSEAQDSCSSSLLEPPNFHSLVVSDPSFMDQLVLQIIHETQGSLWFTE